MPTKLRTTKSGSYVDTVTKYYEGVFLECFYLGDSSLLWRNNFQYFVYYSQSSDTQTPAKVQLKEDII